MALPVLRAALREEVAQQLCRRLRKHAARERGVVVSVEKFMLVPEILRYSDYVCTLPSMLMSRFTNVLDMFELPFDDGGFGLRMAWHPRNHVDPAVSWLREQVVGLVPGQPAAQLTT